jgi:hypothetical protein
MRWPEPHCPCGSVLLSLMHHPGLVIRLPAVAPGNFGHPTHNETTQPACRYKPDKCALTNLGGCVFDRLCKGDWFPNKAANKSESGGVCNAS